MTGHRVESKRTKSPALPKEVIVIGPRAYRDRFGREYTVVWDGRKGDPALRDLHVNLLK